MRWPIIIISGFSVVVLVNLAFIYVAVSTHEQPLPSYVNATDR